MFGELQAYGNSRGIFLVADGLPYPMGNVVEGHSVKMELRSASQGEQLTDKTTDPSDLGNNDVEKLPIVFALGLAPSGAPAQTFTKPVRIIVPFAPGGTSDILARLIGPKLQDAIGQPVVVENKTGAGGNIGADLVAKAEKDGHTLLA